MADNYFLDTDATPTLIEDESGNTLIQMGENTAEAARQASLATAAAGDAVAAAADVQAAVQGGSVGRWFDGTISDTAGAHTFTDNWNVPVDATLTTAAETITFNSTGTAKNLLAKLKSSTGTGDFKGCFEDNWEIDCSLTLLAAFSSADVQSFKVGFSDGVNRFYGIRVASHPGAAGQLFFYFDVAGNQISSAASGFTYSVNDTIRVRVKRSGGTITYIVNWDGGADVVPGSPTTMSYSAASSVEFPRIFSTPVVNFLQGHVRLDSAKITIAGGNADVAIPGTSIEQGHVVSSFALGWAQLLKAAHPGQVMVCGAPSATSSDWVAALPDLLLTCPGEVLLAPFPNDVLLTVPLATTQVNVALMAAQCDAAGAKLRLVNALPHSSYSTAINSWLAATDYTVIDVFTATVGTSPAMNAAYVAAPPSGSPHMNDAGHEVVFDAVDPALIDLGSFTRLKYRVSTDPTMAADGDEILPSQSAVKGHVAAQRGSGTSALGYGTGAGGAVTQLTSKATDVTLNKLTGTITMHNAALASSTAVGFNLLNSQIEATDTVSLTIKGGGTSGAYHAYPDTMGAGSCKIWLRNLTAGSLSEAVQINVAVIKGKAA